MSDRHDLRRQTREIHEALSRFEREQLVDILTHVFRTYVMEGAALAPPQSSSLGDELTGLSFAQLIERLQLRLDLPELQLFEVQGSRVQVRLDGRLQPLETPTSRAEAPARNAPPPAPVASAPPPASPGTSVSEVRAAAPPPPGVMPAGHASASRPEATARPPAGRATSAGLASSAAPARPAAPAAPPAPAPKPESKPADEPNQGRFGLLEID